MCQNLQTSSRSKERRFGSLNHQQPHKQALIERLWRTLAILLQRMRKGTKNFDWPKALPDAIENYNGTWHRSIKATPIELLERKKLNREKSWRIYEERNVVRVKTKKHLFEGRYSNIRQHSGCS